MKKYEFFAGDTKQVGNVVLQRVISTRQLMLADGNVLEQGTLGGYIQSERNLSHEGHCWVADEAIVSGKATVYGNALVKEQAMVCGRAQVYGSAIVSGQSKLSDCSKAGGKVVVYNQDLSGIDTRVGG